MKQYITVKQLNELSENGKNKLQKWWNPQRGDWFAIFDKKWPKEGWSVDLLEEYDGTWHFQNNNSLEDFIKTIKETDDEWYLPFLSIGQMIEFLMDANEPDDGFDVICISWGDLSLGFFTGEYCDELWNMVKEILEKDEK